MVKRQARLLLGTSFLVSAFATAADRSTAQDAAHYEQKVRPLLAQRCYACHGALKQEGELRLDTVASMKGETGGPEVVSPGDAEASELIARVTAADAELRMPPGDEGAPLNEAEIEALRSWINAGAPAPLNDQPEADPEEHWAFRAPIRPPLPTDATTNHPIDLFLNQAQQSRQLVAAAPAAPALLLRRVYLDLIGLPPTESETAHFLADPSQEHYEQIVDRLLDDPRYAERWARHWMDIWRYSDWWGLGQEVRNSQKHIWHWRDWIVESLDQDLGYDQMVQLMLAADELAPSDPAALRATGYLARQYFKFNRDTWLDETIEHTGKAFLGLTLNCARCHDHKYDPVSAREYYQLRAFFEPYQVRTDLVPGQTTVEGDGIPRAFDCRLDQPTFRYLRGDAKQPLTDEPLGPELPRILAFDQFPIEPIALPVEAYQPGVQPWVVDAYRQQAEQSIAARQSELVAAQTALAEAIERERVRELELQTEAPAADGAESVVDQPKPLIVDEFRSLDDSRWRRLGGDWVVTDQGIEQRSEATERSGLELIGEVPADFEARFRYTIQGGPMWRSVGLLFDATDTRELLAYTSAYAGGPKVQLAFKNGGSDQYPNDAMKALPIEVGKSVELVVRCRGDLINVDIDGAPALAWRSSIGRTRGALRLITFDAVARLERFELSELDPRVALRTVGDAAARLPSVAEAQLMVERAERKLEVASLMPELIRLRSAADRAKGANPALESSQVSEAIHEAAALERKREWLETHDPWFAARIERAALLDASPGASDGLSAIDQKIQTAEATLAALAQQMEAPGDSYVSLRGSFKTVESPTESAESVAAPFPSTSTGRRRALAYWLTDRRNPLTARVAVNHLWARHFGAPIVPTVFDFGRKGLAPTHPELLDWLAVEFMESGWSMKRMHRLMVTSQAYRRSSSAYGAQSNLEIDPENRMLWRMNSVRMEAQVVRDALLSLAGLLDETRGGPSIPLDQADQSRRRSLYFVHSHNEHDRFLASFDDAAVQECYRRETSIVPQQALALSNSRLALEAARELARRLSAVEQTPELDVASEIELLDDDAFVQRAFRTMLSFDPSPREAELCRNALENWREISGSVDPVEVRALLILSLINHNDFVTIR